LGGDDHVDPLARGHDVGGRVVLVPGAVPVEGELGAIELTGVGNRRVDVVAVCRGLRHLGEADAVDDGDLHAGRTVGRDREAVEAQVPVRTAVGQLPGGELEVDPGLARGVDDDRVLGDLRPLRL